MPLFLAKLRDWYRHDDDGQRHPVSQSIQQLDGYAAGLMWKLIGRLIEVQRFVLDEPWRGVVQVVRDNMHHEDDEPVQQSRWNQANVAHGRPRRSQLLSSDLRHGDGSLLYLMVVMQQV
jgi:hypothetical protein